MEPLLRITLLGRVCVEFMTGAGAPPQLLQPRKLALLAYLGAEDRPVPRDEIVGIMWAEAPEPRARASLSQLLHAIRSDCAADIFLVAGKSVGVSPELVQCDVAEFYRLLERLSPEETLRRFRGPFMPGFTLPAESAFEDWCSRQRERLDIALADVAWRAAERAGDKREGLHYLELASTVRPWDEAILRRRMRALAVHGERAAGLALYDEYARQLRVKLGISPARQTHALAAELLASQETTPSSDPIEVPRDASAVMTALPPRRRIVKAPMHLLRRRVLQLTGVTVLIGAVLLGALISRQVQGVSRSRPLVALTGLDVSGADANRRSELLHRLTGLLAADTMFSLTVASPSQADIVISGAIDLNAYGPRGTVVLQSERGRVLGTLPIAYPAQSDAAAAEDLAQRLRQMIVLFSAADDESRSIVRLEQRLSDATRHGEQGAYGLAEATLTRIMKELAATTLKPATKRAMTSQVWERRAWIALLRGDRPAATANFQNAIDALSSSSVPRDNAARQRLADLHYLAWAADTLDVSRHLSSAIDHLYEIDEEGRTPAAWLRLSAALYSLGHYAEAYSAANAARSHPATKGVPEELALLLFKSAFNAKKDRTAAAECEAIRKYLPTSWPPIACAAFMAGWAGAAYRPADLLNELGTIEEPEPLRSFTRAKVSVLIAAAAARRGDSVLCDSLLRHSPNVPMMRISRYSARLP
jgi:DNA-binding SARP family transcriptional activator/tetratricopeptide (TPR) repeat protein